MNEKGVNEKRTIRANAISARDYNEIIPRGDECE